MPVKSIIMNIYMLNNEQDKTIITSFNKIHNGVFKTQTYKK